MVNKFIRNNAIKLVITGGIVVGLVVIARRFNVGGTVASGAFELGQAGGSVITQPIAGLVDTLTKGIDDIRLNAQDLFGGLGTAGADFQEAFTGNRDAIGDFFSEDSSNDKPNTDSSPSIGRTSQPQVNLTSFLSEQSIRERIVNATNANTAQGSVNTRGTFRDTSSLGFGDFGSAQAQETALQRAIRENRERFPQFFGA